MSSVLCHVNDGKLVLDEPLPGEWHEGLVLRVLPFDEISIVDDTFATAAEWEKYFESLEEFQLTDAQAAEWDRNLNELKVQGKKDWDRRSREIEGHFP